MATTVQFLSDLEVINNSGDYGQLVIVFTDPAGSGNTPLNMADVGVKVGDWGSITWAYDFEDALLVPGTWTVKLFDRDGDWSSSNSLLSYFFGSSKTAFGKDAKVSLYLNSNLEYVGIIQEDSIKYDRGERSVRFTCDPSSMILNKQLLYAADGTTPLNTLGFTLHAEYRVTDILEAIYQMVDPTISLGSGLEVFHDWTFYGELQNPNPPYNLWTLSDINFGEIYQKIDPLIFEYGYGLATMGDVLKKLALDWCCFTGLIHKERAFFQKLFTYDSGNTQTLGLVHNRALNYAYQTLDYVQFTVTGFTPVVYSRGTDNHIEGRSLARVALPQFFTNKSFTNVSANIARSAGQDGYYPVYKVGDPNLLGGSQTDSGNLMAEFWYNFRSNLQRCQVDHIVASGIMYDFLKNFTDDGRKYQIISMTKRLAASITEFDAIYLGQA